MTAPKRPAPKRPAPKCPRAQTAAPKRRRPNGGAQTAAPRSHVPIYKALHPISTCNSIRSLRMPLEFASSKQARRDGGEAGRNFRAPSSHGGPELSAVLTHGGVLGFALQTSTYSYVLPCYLYYWSWLGPKLQHSGPYG